MCVVNPTEGTPCRGTRSSAHVPVVDKNKKSSASVRQSAVQDRKEMAPLAVGSREDACTSSTASILELHKVP